MDESESLSHTTWDCKYHLAFNPKCRRKTLYLEWRQHLGEVLRKLALQKEAGHLMPDHAYAYLDCAQKYAASQIVGFIKGQKQADRGFPQRHGLLVRYVRASSRPA